MVVRQRNHETRDFKKQQAAQREQEGLMLNEKNNQARLNAKQAIEQNKNANATKNAQEADRLKQERMQHEEMIGMQKKADELKAQSMKQMIRS